MLTRSHGNLRPIPANTAYYDPRVYEGVSPVARAIDEREVVPSILIKYDINRDNHYLHLKYRDSLFEINSLKDEIEHLRGRVEQLTMKAREDDQFIRTLEMENDDLKLKAVHLEKNVKYRYNELSDIQNDHTNEVISLRQTNKKLRNQIVDLKQKMYNSEFLRPKYTNRMGASAVYSRKKHDPYYNDSYVQENQYEKGNSKVLQVFLTKKRLLGLQDYMDTHRQTIKGLKHIHADGIDQDKANELMGMLRFLTNELISILYTVFIYSYDHLEKRKKLEFCLISNSLTVFTMKFKTFAASSFKILKKVSKFIRKAWKILKKHPHLASTVSKDMIKSFLNKNWLEAEAEGRYNRQYDNDYHRRNNLNEFIIDSLCEIRVRNKKDGGFDDASIIHLYRLFSLKYRIENPLVSKPHGKIDPDISHALDKELVKAISDSVLDSNEFYEKKKKKKDSS